MADKVKTVPYSPVYKQAIIDLLDSKPFKQEIWEWQFVENPYAGTFNPVILIDKWGTVIGFNGTMPVRINIDGQIVNGLWSCDFVVDDRYQGKGYGRLIKESLHTRSSLIMALGISGMAAPVLLRMGWKKNNIVDSYRKLNRISRSKSILIKLVQYINRVGARGRPRQTNHWDLTISRELPDASEMDRLWATVSPGYRKIVVRDHAYLHWRYEQHPLAAYTFISARGPSGLAALLVVRITQTSAHVIDYVGPAIDYGVKAALLDRFIKLTTGQEYLTCTTSDAEWKQLLLDSGFYKQHGKPRFYIYSQAVPDTGGFADWFIMAGDSDGDMLKASEEGPFRPNRIGRTEQLEVRQLDEADFLEMETEWSRLVGVSDADPLFMGWAWQSLWWRQWGRKRGYQLRLLAVYDDANRLVALAPLYRTRVRLHPIYHFSQLQFVGSSWGGADTVRSEYLDFIVDRRFAVEARQVLLSHLERDKGWDQFIFSDLDTRSPTRKLLAQKNWLGDCYTRVVQTDTGISVDVSGVFTDYLTRLGPDTRYRAFNQRKYLNELGEVKLIHATPATSSSCLDSLNQLHALRWGRPCFGEESLDFHKQLAAVLGGSGNLELTMIKLSDRPVSVLYDVRVGGREYNIQAGFDSNLDRKLSPGFLHLGYAIESAFSCEHVSELDLLAGSGKNTFYKSHFSSRMAGFITLQINRAQPMKLLYRIYDLLPPVVKAVIKPRFMGRFREQSGTYTS